MYYAFLGRHIVNSRGVDTSILFGFTKYLLELLEREKPTHVAVSSRSSRRHLPQQAVSRVQGKPRGDPQLVIDALEPLTGIVRP